MKTAAFAAACALLALAPSAQAKLKTPHFAPPAAESGGGPAEPGSEGKVFRVKVEAEFDGMAHSADFLVEDANQSNYVQGGEKAFSTESKGVKSLEFKKWGYIVNVLPVEDPNRPGRVSLQMQIEVSGPVAGKDGVEVRTWQLQTSLHVLKGRPKTVARGTGKAVVTVTDEPDGD